jgi:hypothetical protein
MITAIISLLGSSAVGSIIGGIFAFLNRKADAEAKKLELEHERARWTHDLAVRDKDLEIAKAEAQGKKEVAIIEGEALVGAAQLKAIAEVQVAERVTAEEITAAGKWGFLLVWVSVFTKSIRPVLTLALAAAALYLNWIVIAKLTANWETMSAAQQYDAGMQAFAWVTAQASMAFGYWFVSRGAGK